MSNALKSIFAGDQGPIMDYEVLDLKIDGDPAVDVLTTASMFDVITRVTMVLRWADASVDFTKIANEAAALTNGFFIQYSGEGFLGATNVIKDNGDFYNIGYDTILNADGVATPNQILTARWNFAGRILPWGIKMWDGETFGFRVQDDMSVLATIVTLEAIVEGYRFPD